MLYYVHKIMLRTMTFIICGESVFCERQRYVRKNAHENVTVIQIQNIVVYAF